VRARATGPVTPLRAVVLDLDGVVTRTAALHARAWTRTFDDLLAAHPELPAAARRPFDPRADYRRHIDGKPRYDGVRDFLAARGVTLPEGTPDDPPAAETVHGVGNRKNARFLALLRDEGVATYPDAVAQLRRWRRAGLRTAMVTSSRNGALVVERAGLADLFDATLDGAEAARLGLPGKPAPDTFVEAARRLGVAPAAAAVLEDAEPGVTAGRAGGFGLVVGVARDGGEGGHAAALRAHGADLVVRDLHALGDLTPEDLAATGDAATNDAATNDASTNDAATNDAAASDATTREAR
jgi:alpha,alpha-trehalase